eukprot:1185993-Prorocentrum_minimum.AAC.1
MPPCFPDDRCVVMPQRPLTKGSPAQPRTHQPSVCARQGCARLVPRENVPALPASDWFLAQRGNLMPPPLRHRNLPTN